MKKLKVLVVLAMVVLLISGCGNKEINTLDIEKTSDVIEEHLADMKKVDDETLENVYNFDLSLFSQYVIKENEDGDIYAIIKTNDKNKVEDSMDEYFEKVKEFNTAYSPERLEILDDRLKKNIGEYLVYIVSKDASSIYQDVVDSME